MPTMLERTPPAQPTTKFNRRAASAAPAGKTGLTPVRPQTAQESVDATKGRMQQVGAGYTGSIYSPPGSYSAAKPAAPGPGPAPAPGHGGVDVNSYKGSRYAPQTIADRNAPSGLSPNPAAAIPAPGYIPQPSAELGADRALRARFGAPPNERGQIDVADKNGVRSLSVPPPIQNPSSVPMTPTPVAPAAPAAVKPPAQTEANNPLTGAATTQAPSTTAPINPGQALGVNQRGAGVARGADAGPVDANVGGSGLYAKRFSNPHSAAIYGNFVRRIFGDQQQG